MLKYLILIILLSNGVLFASDKDSINDSDKNSIEIKDLKTEIFYYIAGIHLFQV
ncbi:MAG: hypothetical protein IAE65_00670 [Ignavibacteria bacterium]|nr:hypothetical protein [Ignavibacteria bacterium]